MPKWPAWIMLGVAAACAYPAMTNPTPIDATLELYEARGNEPGWEVLIDKRRLTYTGSHGAKAISLERPDPQSAANGRRYETARVTLDVTYTRCNDDLTGRGYEHQVAVTADGRSFRGCGGTRRSDWDL